MCFGGRALGHIEVFCFVIQPLHDFGQNQTLLVLFFNAANFQVSSEMGSGPSGPNCVSAGGVLWQANQDTTMGPPYIMIRNYQESMLSGQNLQK